MAAIPNDIYIGSLDSPSFHFTNDDIYSVTGDFGISLAGEELSIDTMTGDVMFEVASPKVIVPKASEKLLLEEYYTNMNFYSYTDNPDRTTTHRYAKGAYLVNSAISYVDEYTVSEVWGSDYEAHKGEYYITSSAVYKILEDTTITKTSDYILHYTRSSSTDYYDLVIGDSLAVGTLSVNASTGALTFTSTGTYTISESIMSTIDGKCFYDADADKYYKIDADEYTVQETVIHCAVWKPEVNRDWRVTANPVKKVSVINNGGYRTTISDELTSLTAYSRTSPSLTRVMYVYDYVTRSGSSIVGGTYTRTVFDYNSDYSVLYGKYLNATGGGYYYVSPNEDIVKTHDSSYVVTIKTQRVYATNETVTYAGIRSTDGLILSGHYTESLGNIPYGTPVYFYSNSSLVAKMYAKTVTRTGKARFKIEAMSYVGLLDRQYHYGGYYNGATFKSVVDDILKPPFRSTYQPVEYLESHGTEYIDTGLVPSYDLKVWLKASGVEALSGESYCPIMGFYDDTSDGTYTYNGTTYTKHKAINFKAPATATVGGWSISSGGAITDSFSMTANYNLNCVVRENGTVASLPSENRYQFTVSETMPLFGIKNNTDDHSTWVIEKGKCRIYRCKISQQGILIKDYIPVYRVSDGVAGLYEGVSGTFLTNAGTGTFGMGHEIELTDYSAISSWGDNGYAADVTLEYDPQVENTLVYGCLPYDTKRNNLYRLIFATNVNLIKSSTGGFVFSWIYSTDPTEIPDERVYDSGDIEYPGEVSSVAVTEHAYSYLSTTASQVVFDNTNDTSSQSGKFIAAFTTVPVNKETLTTTGTIVVDTAGETCALISGKGTISAIPYVHTSQTLSQTISDSKGATKAISVGDDMLIVLANSGKVLERLVAYYTKAKKIHTDIVMGAERCGGYYSFTDAFYDSAEAYLSSYSFTSSSFIKGNCEMIADYTPVTGANNYTNAQVLTESGTFTVPQSVISKGSSGSIRIVLVGGGTGGSSGLAGEAGGRAEESNQFGTGGKGGEGGTAGEGGKILEVTITSPSSAYSYRCGSGGSGGDETTSTSTTNAGSAGTATTFGSYTSANGAVSATGVTNLFNGQVYGASGISGVAGGQGAGSEAPTEGSQYVYYTLGDGTRVRYYEAIPVTYGGETYTGGEAGEPYYKPWTTTPTKYYYDLAGGLGGGPAVGVNGSDGTDPSYDSSSGYGGEGGEGATPVQASAAINYGYGGNGGHGGGGGGGGGGSSSLYNPANYTYSISEPGYGGYGGNGGEGGQGGAGCIIVYW